MQIFQLASLTLVVSLFCVHAQEPIPETAMPVTPPDPVKGYVVVDHGDGVWFLTEGAYWSMAVLSRPTTSHSSSNSNGYGNGTGHSGSSSSHSRSLLIIDCPTGFYNSSSFMAAIREVMHKAGVSRVSDILYSHHHTDHIGMTYLVKNAFHDAKIHASSDVCAILAHRKDSHRPVPDHCYPGNFTLTAYGVTAYAIGDAHSRGNRAIYLPHSKIFMYVDIVFPGWTMFRDLAQAEYTPSFVEAHDKILQFDFNIYVGGHLTRLGNRQDVKIQREYVNDLVANGQYALDRINWGLAQTLGTFDPKSPNYLNYWYLWDQVEGQMVATCVARTLAKWDHLLGAVDLWTYTHCFRVIESLNID